MSKIFKIAGGALALIAIFMMFLPQVSVEWAIFGKETIALPALVGGESKYAVDFNGVGSGLAGYILAGVGGLLLLAVAFVPFFKEHDVLNYLLTGVALVCLIVAIFLIFFIRKGFVDANGLASDKVFVGAGAMIGGSLASLGLAVGGLGLIVDFAK